jgi:acyl dehydratase
VEATLLRAALPSIPVVNLLPGVRKTGGDPSSVHETRTATVDREQVRAYAAVCGFPVKDTAPLTFPHVLAFPLHMAVMSSPQFPFPAIGTVHLGNRITAHRQVRIGETVRIEVHAAPLVPHPKGTAVDFVATVSVDEEPVWESASTYLRLGRRVSTGSTDEGAGSTDEGAGSTDEGTRSTDEGDRSTDAAAEVVPGKVTWRLPGDLGRRYAAVSGDHNPIHLYPLTARALGFRRQIAHGMWSLARCVAAVENRLPDAVTVDATFRKPIFLPGSVAFGVVPRADGLAFALTSPKTGGPHVTGRTHPA